MFTCLKLIPLSGFSALQVRYSQRHYRSLQIFLFQFDDSRTGLLLFGIFFFPWTLGWEVSWRSSSQENGYKSLLRSNLNLFSQVQQKFNEGLLWIRHWVTEMSSPRTLLMVWEKQPTLYSVTALAWINMMTEVSRQPGDSIVCLEAKYLENRKLGFFMSIERH